MRLPDPIAVLLGATLGGGVRIAIGQLMPDAAVFSWDIAVINVVGSFALGLLAARLADLGPQWWAPFATTGMLGGFTTFSAVAALRWTTDASVPVALGALIAITAAAVAGAALGWRLGAAALGEPPDTVEHPIEEDEL